MERCRNDGVAMAVKEGDVMGLIECARVCRFAGALVIDFHEPAFAMAVQLPYRACSPQTEEDAQRAVQFALSF